MILDILQVFDMASGLKTNIQKSSVTPIQCSTDELSLIHDHLPCEIKEFQCKYLGLPLSIKKLTRAQIQPIIDRIADQLRG